MIMLHIARSFLHKMLGNNLLGIYLFEFNKWEYQKNVWHLFKVNHKDTRTTQ